MKYQVRAIQLVDKEKKPIYVVLIDPAYEGKTAEGGDYIIKLVKDHLGGEYFQYKSISVHHHWSNIEAWKSGQLDKLAVYWGEQIVGGKLYTFEIPIRIDGCTPQGWAKMISRDEDWKWILYEFLSD